MSTNKINTAQILLQDVPFFDVMRYTLSIYRIALSFSRVCCPTDINEIIWNETPNTEETGLYNNMHVYYLKVLHLEDVIA